MMKFHLPHSHFSLVLLVFSIIISLDPSSPNFFSLGINHPASLNNGIFFGLVTSDTEKGAKRRIFQFTQWLQYLHLYNYGYTYIIEGNSNISYNHSAIVPKYIIKGGPNADRAAKKLSAAYHFYYSTTYSWLWISNDDVSVSIPRLHNLVNFLNKKYDTNKDIIVRGACVGHPNPFIQGGSGMFLSRAAAYNFTESGVQWIREKVTNEDDVNFNEYLKTLGETPASCNAPFMIGHDFVKSFFPINMTAIPECNDTENSPKSCFKQPQSADTLVAIHDNYYPYGWSELEDLIKHTGQGLMFYNIPFYAKLCKITNTSSR